MFFEKKNLVWFAQIPATMVMKKSRFKLFWPKTSSSTYYDPKYLQNTFETVIKPIYSLKN
jgi:hypothetical protein